METFNLSLIAWVLFALAVGIISLTAYGVVAFVNASQSNVKNALYDRICKAASNYVRALAQDPSLEGLASEEKKQRAMVWIMALADKLNFDLTPAEASRIIESAVWAMKHGLEKVADALAD